MKEWSNDPILVDLSLLWALDYMYYYIIYYVTLDRSYNIECRSRFCMVCTLKEIMLDGQQTTLVSPVKLHKNMNSM